MIFLEGSPDPARQKRRGGTGGIGGGEVGAPWLSIDIFSYSLSAIHPSFSLPWFGNSFFSLQSRFTGLNTWYSMFILLYSFFALLGLDVSRYTSFWSPNATLLLLCGFSCQRTVCKIPGLMVIDRATTGTIWSNVVAAQVSQIVVA